MTNQAVSFVSAPSHTHTHLTLRVFSSLSNDSRGRRLARSLALVHRTKQVMSVSHTWDAAEGGWQGSCVEELNALLNVWFFYLHWAQFGFLPSFSFDWLFSFILILLFNYPGPRLLRQLAKKIKSTFEVHHLSSFISLLLSLFSSQISQWPLNWGHGAPVL
jgi:hypothetical protein